VGRLGEPASHGCIRLASENAAAFFKLVEAYGRQNTTIIVTA
ncbi:MAG: L,D-transpeptidase, partial [Bauldia sp.]|nr:L,D-transpeptidase [Bauldia sp.]